VYISTSHIKFDTHHWCNFPFRSQWSCGNIVFLWKKSVKLSKIMSIYYRVNTWRKLWRVTVMFTLFW